MISYHTNTGHYAYNKDYFASTTNKSPLRALANGEDGGNGMYRYGASAFPAETWSSSNYWVDVVFIPQPAPTASTCSIWGNSTTPGTVSVPDSRAVELGMKFRTEVSGTGSTLL